MTRSETFIRNNYRTQSINAMAKHLTVSCSTVRRAMKANGWQPMDARCKEIFDLDKEGMFNWNIAMQQDFTMMKN